MPPSQDEPSGPPQRPRGEFLGSPRFCSRHYVDSIFIEFYRIFISSTAQKQAEFTTYNGRLRQRRLNTRASTTLPSDSGSLFYGSNETHADCMESYHRRASAPGLDNTAARPEALGIPASARHEPNPSGWPSYAPPHGPSSQQWFMTPAPPQHPYGMGMPPPPHHGGDPGRYPSCAPSDIPGSGVPPQHAYSGPSAQLGYAVYTSMYTQPTSAASAGGPAALTHVQGRALGADSEGSTTSARNKNGKRGRAKTTRGGAKRA
ncbi:hypothetical protein NUW54_g13266 [Trametes sanguinea]|uniref:Uncharacterized protein n=1 Tax=Trametes sanguinea TaxID=158606 RepID=A0ACC1MMM5_9APHY|nr:hypothetical protein NUW54_g13266 [Trametes sanguinea]